MAISKSILEEVELKTGSQLYVQISNSGRVSLSYDSTETSFNVWLTKVEAEAYAKAILKAIEESHDV